MEINEALNQTEIYLTHNKDDIPETVYNYIAYAINCDREYINMVKRWKGEVKPPKYMDLLSGKY